MSMAKASLQPHLQLCSSMACNFSHEHVICFGQPNRTADMRHEHCSDILWSEKSEHKTHEPMALTIAKLETLDQTSHASRD